MKRASILVALILVMSQVGWADESPTVATHEANATAHEMEDRLPEFSWSTVPVRLRIRKSTAYTKDEITQIARHPIIVFEKANGHMAYITTPDEYDAGGYESLATLYGRQTGDRVVAECTRLLDVIR